MDLLKLTTLEEFEALENPVTSIQITYKSTTMRGHLSKFVNKKGYTKDFDVTMWLAFRESIIKSKINKGLATIKFIQ